jgi:hypothetical protein
MDDKKQLEEAFMAGFVSARKSGFTTNKLHPVTERAARENFDRWHGRNKND